MGWAFLQDRAVPAVDRGRVHTDQDLVRARCGVRSSAAITITLGSPHCERIAACMGGSIVHARVPALLKHVAGTPQ